MAAITASMVAELRAKTDAPMMECKKALTEAEGNMERAEELLRVKLGSKAGKAASRIAAEGVVAASVAGTTGALVEVNCETDFVARTNDFANLAQQLAEHIAAAAPIAVSRDALAPDVIEAKRLAFENEVRATGKPEPLVAKIVAGKIEAYFGDVILVDQKWVREPKVKVADLIHEVGAKTGENIQVRRFARFHMGIA